ncbi:hypothetical protein ELH24_09905 [Rhizobium ruizarguesonis]|uniref:hypothetical protein n=1 Tax=Rhizobium ruizarguesonis TaxID=2081791 RepID=UPI00102F35A0|nr:hypothetical protein [Rhizobium ruizarguesonis]TBC98960.1 hypothetical protein ELH25_09860 [Rhizobium ruizarguesonis]TBD15810.1 hypothetical protein ELH24_09905 [Rhizobium ruizarguesonis]TBD27727.1 hypothetical protein ELH20_09190 [Rhizobium ruizarguesonis]TBE32902.1 hypothetical protein ELH07_09710 [Rhizobium ruizarguesonis]TBE96825.1 hypothetical protein ELG98_09660 [Rhizobium ruizarguesonis]
MGRKLIAREYKLLLDSQIFSQAPNLEVANAFWAQRIRQIVRIADPKAGPFNGDGWRLIRFWDTPNRDLSYNDLTLRTRQDTKSDFAASGVRQATLKLRMPDQFIVATARLAKPEDEEAGNVETKFEEDIGPLEVLARPPDEQPKVVTPLKLSTRNRFSLSSGIDLTPNGPLDRFDQVLALFPGVAELVCVSPGQSDLNLVGGPLIHEYVFKGSEVALVEGAKAKFTLSIWCFDAPLNQPDVAEMSFVVKTDNGKMSGRVARQAYNLFINFQENLSEIIDQDHTSKTSLALPDRASR